MNSRTIRNLQKKYGLKSIKMQFQMELHGVNLPNLHKGVKNYSNQERVIFLQNLITFTFIPLSLQDMIFLKVL